MRPVIDPRNGDIEDDASSPDRHSLLSLAGTLLAEISFPKLAMAWIWLVVAPGLLLGLAPSPRLGLDRRALQQDPRSVRRTVARRPAVGYHHRRPSRRAHAVSAGRGELLVAERACRAAWLRGLSGRPKAPRRALAAGASNRSATRPAA